MDNTVVFPETPQEVSPLANLLKLAKDHDEKKNLVVAYWARMSACRLAERLAIGIESPKTEELISKLQNWLTTTKAANLDNEGITKETAAKAIIEKYTLTLFNYGDEYDKMQIYNKDTVKFFYTVGVLMNLLEQFGPLEEDIKQKCRYARWKAIYIRNCLRIGEFPSRGLPIVYTESASGTVQNSTRSVVKFAAHPKFIRNIPASTAAAEMNKAFASKPVAPNIPSEENFSLNVPKKSNVDNTHVHASSSKTVSEEVSVAPENMRKAQMFCEFVASALKHNDVKCAVENLHEILKLLKVEGDE